MKRIEDSTLGDDKKGFQMLANKKAKGNEPKPTDPEVPGLPGVPELPGIPGKLRHYDLGGMVDSGQPTDWHDKLKAVLQAMGVAGQTSMAPFTGNGLAEGVQNVVSPPTPNDASGTPYMQGAANKLMSVPPPVLTGQPTPPAAPVALSTPERVQTPPVVPNNPVSVPPKAPIAPEGVQNAAQGGDVAKMLQTMTGGDSETLSRLNQSLQDHDKRTQFAQALAIIGDTLGNVGMARAGRTPEGFTSTKLVGDMADKQRGLMTEKAKADLANDPHSQTSQMIQTAAMQMLGIKPGDPREATIRRVPAAVLSAQLPGLTDATKVAVEREKNAQSGAEHKDTIAVEREKIASQAAANKATVDVARMGKETEEAKLKADERHKGVEEANQTLEHTSPLNPFNWGIRGKARETIEGGTPAHGVPDLGSTFNGHKVLKVTKVK